MTEYVDDSKRDRSFASMRSRAAGVRSNGESLVDDSRRPGPGVERRRGELCILNDVARALNASIDLPTLLQRALEKVAELLGLDTGWVLLFDESTGEPHMAASQNLPACFVQEPERMAGWCICLESYRKGALDAASNVGVVRCSRLGKLSLAQGDTAGLRYHASVPLQVCVGNGKFDPAGGERPCVSFKRLGMLNVATPEWRQLDEDELGLLRTIGDVLAVAVERVRLYEHQLEAAQTEERNRLAREIHDTIAQDFSAIAFQLEAAEAMMEQDAEPERIRRSIQAALDLTRKGLEETRRSVLDLRAAPLDGRTLNEALSALVESADATHEPAVSFVQASAGRSLPAAVEVGLYRIAQEALQNALHHASAAQVTLRLEVETDVVRLHLEDDGCGFDLGGISEARAAGRFGLVGMRERARLLGGQLRIESTPDAGTRIRAEVPLTSRSDAAET